MSEGKGELAMRGQAWRRYLTVVVLVCALTALVPPAPAAATDLAAGMCSASLSDPAYTTYVASRGCDGDDTTQWVAASSAGAVKCLVIDLGQAEDVAGYVVRSRIENTAIGVWSITTTPGTSPVNCSVAGGWTNREEAGAETPVTVACGAVNCDEHTYTFAATVTARYWGITSHGDSGGSQIFTVELDSATIPADFTDYVYGLKLAHPSFQRVVSWWWGKTWSGEWHLTDSDDTILAGTYFAAEEQGTPFSYAIPCVPVCGDDTYTITITEDGGYETVFYDIASSVNGYAIAPVTHGIFSSADACYNLTLDQCADPLDGAADSMFVRFTVVRPGTDTNESNIDGTISIGLWDRTNTEPCMFVGSYVTTDVLTFPGSYFQGATGWNQAGGFFNADGEQEILLLWQSVLDPLYYTCYRLAVDVTTGGATATRDTPVTVVTPCAPGNLPCEVGRAIGRALDELFGVARDIWSEGIDTAHDAMMEKVPFAYIIIGIDGINAQLARATPEVDASDDCAGVTLAVPLYYGTSPSTPTPTTVPFTVLNCASLEPVMGTTWYQAVRTAMDPALWLLFAWSQLKALQPRTSLNG